MEKPRGDSKSVKTAKGDIAEELTDVLYWVLLLRHDLQIDPLQALAQKLKKNAKKYPVRKAKTATQNTTGYEMITYSATKSEFKTDVFNNVIVDKLVESLRNKKVPATNPAHIRSYQNSLLFMDTVLQDRAIPRGDCGETLYLIENGRIRPSKSLADCLSSMLIPKPVGHGRLPRSSGPRGKRYARQARGGVCRPVRVLAMRAESCSSNFPAQGKREFVMMDDQKLV